MMKCEALDIQDPGQRKMHEVYIAGPHTSKYSAIWSFNGRRRVSWIVDTSS